MVHVCDSIKYAGIRCAVGIVTVLRHLAGERLLRRYLGGQTPSFQRPEEAANSKAHQLQMGADPESLLLKAGRFEVDRLPFMREARKALVTCNASGVQEHKSVRVQEYKSMRVQEYKSRRV